MISTKGRYALRIMIDLAERRNDGYIPLRDIAERQEISKKYLEIIMKELVKGNMVSGHGGRGGGFVLCRAPEAYTVGEILELMEGSLAPVACLARGALPCGRAPACKTRSMWAEFDQMVRSYFFGKTLADFL